MGKEPSFRYGGFEFRTICGECKQSMPVNGPLLELDCARCGAKNTIEDANLGGYIERIETAHLDMQAGERLHATAVGNQRQWRCAIVAEKPRCGICEAALPVDQIPVGTDEDRACACGEPYSTFPAPDWLKRHLDSSVQVYLADRPGPLKQTTSGQQIPQVSSGPTEAIVMSCPGCSAGLEMTTETAHHAKCQFCGIELNLPPVLWRKLHPLPRMRTWYMRFEGPSLAMKRLEQAKQKDAKNAEVSQTRERKESRAKLLSWIGWAIVAVMAIAVAIIASQAEAAP
ncbi:MAG: hypothetical protein JRF33_11695 [Deltaproteobacteria bacterium]|nr:hypothetical protein [Deltaproteobacteria bacterium]